MATDFSKPIVTDAYATLLPGVVAAHLDLARQLEPTLTGTSTNVPTGAVRWNATTIRWERYNGSSWVTLPSAGDNVYAISISGNAATASTCSGNAATATTAAACSGNAATATTAAACSGNAATASNAIGVGQAYVQYTQVSGTRVANVTYTNSTGRTITVWAGARVSPTYGSANLIGTSGTSVSSYFANETSGWVHVTLMAIVPPGGTYTLSLGGTSVSMNWYELR